MSEYTKPPGLLFRWRWLIASERGPSSPTTRHVLLTLSLHMAADGGRAFPSEQRLAQETGLSERAVSTHLRLASEKGWIVRRRRRQIGKDWAQYVYQAAVPATLPAPEPRSGPIAESPEGDSHGPARNGDMVPNDVPLNSTGNATDNTTGGVEISETAKAKRRADCAAFLAQARRQIAARESVMPAINKRRRS
jgi:DNA-binding transcriptional MocR family regulator